MNNIRRAMQGKSHRRGVQETRGRKTKTSPKKFRALQRARKYLQKKAGGKKEVPMPKILRRARVKVDPSTARKAFKKYEGVKWRPGREKPQRTKEQRLDRKDWCAAKRRLPKPYFRDTADLIIDCKKYELPLSIKARQHATSKRVRGSYRTRAEGLKMEHTKPNDKRHRINPGGMAWVLGGVVGEKVRLWEYIPGKWNGEVAARMCRGPIQKVLSKERPTKSKWRVVEDSDPAGFKSSEARAAKREVGIEAISLPPYSPDLNPLDFTLWRTIEDRARESLGKKKVSVKKYKAVLRRAALRLSPKIVRAAMDDMRARIGQIYKAGSDNIARD